MIELAAIFSELGISHYLPDFIEQGFDTWETILDITESDFDALGVKLGHRRKLQRKIANSRGLSSDRALASPRNTPTEDRQLEEPRGPGVKGEGKEVNGATNGTTPGVKRKYRRHPKPDENAPERPPSAYVIFSNKMREDLKGRNLSFTEIAKLVGEHWQNLTPGEKDPYEQQAFSAKERYNNELAEYKKTDQYTEYTHYLADFKARHSNPQQTNEPNDAAKRPKFESTSASSAVGSGIASGGASQPMSENRNHHSPSRVYSRNSPTRIVPSPGAPPRLALDVLPGPAGATMPKLNGVGGAAPPAVGAVASPNGPPVLPGYRDSIYPSLPWRDSPRDDKAALYQPLPRIGGPKERPPSMTSVVSTPTPENLNLTGSQQFAHRTGQGHPPPLLTSESTNRSTTSTSSNSTVSSVYYSPRTPMEPSLERALPIPPLYPPKANGGSFESQLPPLRRGSPQIVHGTSPTASHSFGKFSSSMPPLRGLPSLSSSHPLLPNSSSHHNHVDYRGRDFFRPHSGDETILDPVSALLRAGEIVNSNSRGRSGS